jgi:hypothetical protein
MWHSLSLLAKRATTSVAQCSWLFACVQLGLAGSIFSHAPTLVSLALFLAQPSSSGIVAVFVPTAMQMSGLHGNSQLTLCRYFSGRLLGLSLK